GPGPWTFAETEVCTLTHVEDSTEVTVVYDPATGTYTISVTTAVEWADSPVFRLRFDGPNALTIGTDQHTLSNDRRSLSVSDSGFGNVLAGIGRNLQMTALNGDQSVTVSTTDAADPVADFTTCPSPRTS
ncbi:MAG: hypothetical protein AAFQ64_15890, partial [Pseudomonadota bacterium]